MNDNLNQNIETIKRTHQEVKINEELLGALRCTDNLERFISYKGYMLQSSVDQDKAIQVWCEQFDEIKHNTVIVVFGICNLDYYVELVKKWPENYIIAYEPSDDIFYRALSHNDYTKLLNKDNIFFCVGEKKLLLYSVLYEKAGLDSMSKPFFAAIPNYIKLFKEEYRQFKETIMNSFESGLISKNTELRFEEVMADNYFDNMSVLLNEASIVELCESIGKIDNYEDYPAIIVSAGPSLDKNIQLLKEVEGRALIICVDAALNTAVNNDIRPNLVVTGDPIIGDDPFRNKDSRQLPLVAHMVGSTKIRDANKGRKFFMTNPEYYLTNVLNECKKVLPSLITGGSVAHNAFSLAATMGFKTFILIGQDLGYPDNRMHTKGAFREERKVDIDSGDYFYVESIDGGQVLTSQDMDKYRKWFETVFETNPDIHVIDATEGGALIKGTEIMTLREAIDNYCPSKKVDFDSYIDSSDYMFSGEERAFVIETLSKTFEGMDDNIKYLERAKRDYYKLRDINEKRKYNSKEFRALVKKIGEYNKDFEENRDIQLCRIYCAESFYKCVDALKEVYDDEYDNIKNLTSQGIELIDEYIEACKKLKKKWTTLKGRIGSIV